VVRTTCDATVPEHVRDINRDADHLFTATSDDRGFSGLFNDINDVIHYINTNTVSSNGRGAAGTLDIDVSIEVPQCEAVVYGYDTMTSAKTRSSNQLLLIKTLPISSNHTLHINTGQGDHTNGSGSGEDGKSNDDNTNSNNGAVTLLNTITPSTPMATQLLQSFVAATNGAECRLATGIDRSVYHGELSKHFPIGTIVTIGYAELKQDGLPRFPRFERIVITP
jgi:hypothetical protein